MKRARECDILVGEDEVKVRLALGRLYDAFDTDGNGVLTPDELFPVIEEMVEVPWAVTMEHCNRFVEIFDENGDGVIGLDEFATFCQFVALISYLEWQRMEAEETHYEVGDVECVEVTSSNETIDGL